VRACTQQIDTAPLKLEVTDMNATLEVQFGDDPAEVVGNFLRRAVYDGFDVTPAVAELLMYCASRSPHSPRKLTARTCTHAQECSLRPSDVPQTP
jgi:hypothetical protein